MKNRVVRLLLAAGAAIAVAACTPGGGSIYWTLENEVKVEDLSLPNEITVFDVTKIGTSYYAAAGKVWTVEQSVLDAVDGQWDADATIPPPQSGDLCTALVASPFAATLYGGFINGSGNRGLFESTAAPSFGGATAIAALGDAQVALLATADDGVDDWLVVVTAEPHAGADFTFGIAAYDGATWGAFDTSIRASPEDEKPFADVIWSPTLGRWFFTGGAKLYAKAGAGLGALVEAAMTGITAGEVLTGLHDDGTNVYVASRAGAVYYSPDGTSWTRIAAPTISGAHPPLTRFAGPVGTGILLLGSDGFGYYRIDTTNLAAGTDAVTRFPTTTIPLHAASVMKFFLDLPENRAFACTSMGGLWRGAVDGDGSIAWNLE